MPSRQFGRLAAATATRLGVDRRGLAAFRVALGTVLLVDLALRARSLRAHYSDAGVLPRATLAETYPLYRHLSVHALSGAVWFEGLLFALAGFAALALAVGYRTRLATAASLVLLVSLQVRNPLALNAGDALLWRLLLWGLLLPLGSRWAVDAAPDGDDWLVGVATAGLLVQTVVVYATNAVAKLRSAAWTDGVAVRHVFELDHFTVLAGDALAGHPLLLTGANYGWLSLLCASPLLLATTGRRRTALTLAFVAVHLTMAVTLALGVFPLVSIAGLLVFLPSEAWDRIEQAVVWSAGGSGLATLRRPRVPLGRRWPSLSRVAAGVAAVALVAVLATNAVAVGVVAAPAGTPDRAVDHTWSMFAPPPRATHWYEAPATLESGEQVDALSGGPVGTRPADAATRYPSNRWRKVIDGARGEPTVRRRLATDLCERWNATHADDALRVELVVVREPTDFDGRERLVTDSLGNYTCR